MNVANYDAAQRILSYLMRRPVRRLQHSVLPDADRRVAVEVVCGRDGQITVRVADGEGTVRQGVDADAAAVVGGVVVGEAGLEVPVTALVSSGATIRALGMLAQRYATDNRDAVRRGAAVAGWWCERAAHPGSLAVVNMCVVSAATFMVGVVPGDESAALWRQWLGVSDQSLAGMHQWWDRLDCGPRLGGVESVWSDDRWLWQHLLGAVREGRGWQTAESLSLAAIRLRSRCDAADLWEAALLNDAWWRRRAVCAGVVGCGTVDVAGVQAGRIEVLTDQLDLRMKVGAAVQGWIGEVTDTGRDRWSGEVVATSTEDDRLRITIAGMSRRTKVKPVAGQRVTIGPQPPNPSVQFSGRRAVRGLYRARSSWIGHGVSPTVQRREVPLDVMVAAADHGESERGR